MRFAIVFLPFPCILYSNFFPSPLLTLSLHASRGRPLALGPRFRRSALQFTERRCVQGYMFAEATKWPPRAFATAYVLHSTCGQASTRFTILSARRFRGPRATCKNIRSSPRVRFKCVRDDSRMSVLPVLVDEPRNYSNKRSWKRTNYTYKKYG